MALKSCYDKRTVYIVASGKKVFMEVQTEAGGELNPFQTVSWRCRSHHPLSPRDWLYLSVLPVSPHTSTYGLLRGRFLTIDFINWRRRGRTAWLVHTEEWGALEERPWSDLLTRTDSAAQRTADFQHILKNIPRKQKILSHQNIDKEKKKRFNFRTC